MCSFSLVSTLYNLDCTNKRGSKISIRVFFISTRIERYIEISPIKRNSSEFSVGENS